MASLGTLLLVASALNARELEPRAYTPSPVGTRFVIGGFGRSQGPILLDPSLAGDVHGTAERQDLTGLVEPSLKLSVGPRDAPALDPTGFARAPRLRKQAVGNARPSAPRPAPGP